MDQRTIRERISLRDTHLFQTQYPLHVNGAAALVANPLDENVVFQMSDSEDGAVWTAMILVQADGTQGLTVTIPARGQAIMLVQSTAKYVRAQLVAAAQGNVFVDLVQFQPSPNPLPTAY